VALLNLADRGLLAVYDPATWAKKLPAVQWLEVEHSLICAAHDINLGVKLRLLVSKLRLQNVELGLQIRFAFTHFAKNGNRGLLELIGRTHLLAPKDLADKMAKGGPLSDGYHLAVLGIDSRFVHLFCSAVKMPA
jgi:hypothetical protein